MCGLCCDGTLFADVELAGKREATSMELFGLDIEDTDEGPRGLLLQSCRAMKGTRCSIYAHRPKCCRTFECKLLKDVQRGAGGHRTCAGAGRGCVEPDQRSSVCSRWRAPPASSNRPARMSVRILPPRQRHSAAGRMQSNGVAASQRPLPLRGTTTGIGRIREAKVPGRCRMFGIPPASPATLARHTRAHATQVTLRVAS